MAVPVSDSFAEPITKRYRDYSVTDYQNNTYSQTLGLPEYVWNGTNFVDRIIQNNGTHINVYSEQGSFSFTKSGCYITQYVKGFDPTVQTAHGSDIVIDKWFWTIERKNGANPWQMIDPSIFSCVVNTSSNSTGKYLNLQRTDPVSGSYLKVTGSAKNGAPIEDFTELYMNKTAWSGNKFAFVLSAKNVKADSVTFRNGSTIQIPSGITTIDRSQLSVNSLDFVKNGNALFLDWEKAKADFKSITLNKTGTNIDVLFSFNNAGTVLSSGQKMYMDPTFGYTTGIHRSSESSVGNCTNFGANGTNSFVGTDGPANFCYYDAVQFNTGSIPDTARIDSASIKYNVTLSGGTPVCNVVKVPTKPTSTAAATLMADIIAATTIYGSPTCSATATNSVFDMGSTFASDTQSRLSSDWTAFGIIRNPNALDAIQLVKWNSVQLQITYNTPPVTFSLKPMYSNNSTAIQSGYVYQKNSTSTYITVLNSSGYARMPDTAYNTNYNYTVKDSIDQFATNKTYNKKLFASASKQGPVNDYKIACGTTNPAFEAKTNNTNYHNMTYWTAPSCASNDDVSWYLRFIKDGLGPSTNQTTKLILRSLNTTIYNYSPSKVLWNGTAQAFTYVNNVLNATGLQVGNGYKSFRISVQIVTDNVTSAPTGLSGTKPSATQNILTWTAPSAIHGDAVNGYVIWRNGTLLSANTTTTTTSYTDSTAVSGKVYKYMVGALNRIGMSPWSASFTMGPPNRVSDLLASVDTFQTMDLAWTQPALNGGTLLGYQINYTTPFGNPQTIIVNNTGSATTTYLVSGLTEQTDYSFRVGPWTTFGKNMSGNIANQTTPAQFISANFTIGDFNFDSTNPTEVGIYFQRIEHNASTTWVNVTYPNTYTLACDITYTYAMTNHTYHNMVHTTLNPLQYMATFQFRNGTNDIAHIYCWNEAAGRSDNGTYVLTQSDFLLLQQVQDFRNGTYGTHGQLGYLDLITLIIVIFSMVGFNRINESVGMFFCLSAIGAVAYFGIITWPGVVFSALAVVVMFIIGSTKKD